MEQIACTRMLTGFLIYTKLERDGTDEVGSWRMQRGDMKPADLVLAAVSLP